MAYRRSLFHLLDRLLGLSKCLEVIRRPVRGVWINVFEENEVGWGSVFVQCLNGIWSFLFHVWICMG